MRPFLVWVPEALERLDIDFDEMVSKKEFLSMPGSDESMTNYFEDLDQDENGFLGTFCINRVYKNDLRKFLFSFRFGRNSRVDRSPRFCTSQIRSGIFNWKHRYSFKKDVNSDNFWSFALCISKNFINFDIFHGKCAKMLVLNQFADFEAILFFFIYYYW